MLTSARGNMTIGELTKALERLGSQGQNSTIVVKLWDGESLKLINVSRVNASSDRAYIELGDPYNP